MPHRHHGIDYVEIAATDVDAAKRFYTAAFGWNFTDYGPDYAGIAGAENEPEQGGLLRADEIRPGGPLVILYSVDLERSAAQVTDAGGEILQEIYSFPGGRRFHFADPSGNELAVWSES